jgi:two-component system, chemotaxis family, chemotaxis protein CheY
MLLVDDEPLVRQVLARMLEESGFTVIQAENGRHALQVAEQVGPAVNMVVTDIHMPFMTGFVRPGLPHPLPQRTLPLHYRR